MGLSLLFALAVSPALLHSTPPILGQEWEEYPVVQKMNPRGYHPRITFMQESTFMFQTPDFVMQGKYQERDGHYDFKALMAYEIENSDLAKLVPEMGSQGHKFAEDYARSMYNFQGDYSKITGALRIVYPVKEFPRPLELHRFTEGDDQLPWALSDEDRGFQGLWHAPDPFPERMDARSRLKFIGLEGLQQFVKEAMACDGAHFNLLDLRVDSSYRSGPVIGRWAREGSSIKLMGDGGIIVLTISADGRKLLSNSHVLYERG